MVLSTLLVVKVEAFHGLFQRHYQWTHGKFNFNGPALGTVHPSAVPDCCKTDTFCNLLQTLALLGSQIAGATAQLCLVAQNLRPAMCPG
jgi:hypothetical protein